MNQVTNVKNLPKIVFRSKGSMTERVLLHTEVKFEPTDLREELVFVGGGLEW